jgi:hypothetical protein
MDPSYGFVAQQGEAAISGQGSAQGNLGSGNMGVALQNYGQNLASTQYQNALANWNHSQDTLYNRLAGVAGTGQTAATTLGNQGSQMATNVGNIAINQGNNQATATINSANAWINGISNVDKQVMGGLQAYNYQQGIQNGLL